MSAAVAPPPVARMDCADARRAEEELDADSDSRTRSAAPAPAVAHAQRGLPWFFGSEEPEHVRTLILRYMHALSLSEHVRKGSRAPLEFVGCVVRCKLGPVSQADSPLSPTSPASPCSPLSPASPSPALETLDEVRVFQRDAVPLGFAMPLLRVERFLTHWDVDDGLPTRIQRITAKKAIVRQLQQRVVADCVPAVLLARPVFQMDSSFEYSSCVCRPAAAEHDSLTFASPVSHCILQTFVSLGIDMNTGNELSIDTAPSVTMSASSSALAVAASEALPSQLALSPRSGHLQRELSDDTLATLSRQQTAPTAHAQPHTRKETKEVKAAAKSALSFGSADWAADSDWMASFLQGQCGNGNGDAEAVPESAAPRKPPNKAKSPPPAAAAAATREEKQKEKGKHASPALKHLARKRARESPTTTGADSASSEEGGGGGDVDGDGEDIDDVEPHALGDNESDYESDAEGDSEEDQDAEGSAPRKTAARSAAAATATGGKVKSAAEDDDCVFAFDSSLLAGKGKEANGSVAQAKSEAATGAGKRGKGRRKNRGSKHRRGSKRTCASVRSPKPAAEKDTSLRDSARPASTGASTTTTMAASAVAPPSLQRTLSQETRSANGNGDANKNRFALLADDSEEAHRGGDETPSSIEEAGVEVDSGSDDDDDPATRAARLRERRERRAAQPQTLSRSFEEELGDLMMLVNGAHLGLGLCAVAELEAISDSSTPSTSTSSSPQGQKRKTPTQKQRQVHSPVTLVSKSKGQGRSRANAELHV